MNRLQEILQVEREKMLADVRKYRELGWFKRILLSLGLIKLNEPDFIQRFLEWSKGKKVIDSVVTNTEIADNEVTYTRIK